MSRILEPSPSWFEIDPAFYAHGGSCFSEDEHAAIGEASGLRALVGPVTQESRAEEALSLVNLGASVVAWAPDEPSAAAGRQLAADAGLALEWHIGPFEALVAAHTGAFDLLYHGWGGLTPSVDLDTWAATAAALLAPGGRLVLYDRHPFAAVAGFHKGLLVIARGYFPFRPGDNPWTLGDLITSLTAAGFALELFDEFPGSERYHTALDRLPGLQWEQRFRLPAAMLIAAVRAFHAEGLAESAPTG
jgi:SAM-dependent methyltransferase